MTEINDAMLEQVSGGAGKADMIIKVMNSSLPAEIKKKLVNCMKGSPRRQAGKKWNDSPGQTADNDDELSCLLGGQVFHREFGKGKVVFTGNDRVTVQFEEYELKVFPAQTICKYLQPIDRIAKSYFDGVFKKCRQCKAYSLNLDDDGICGKCQNKNSSVGMQPLKCAFCRKVLRKQYYRKSTKHYCLCRACALSIKDDKIKADLQRRNSERGEDFCFITSGEMVSLYFKMVDRLRDRNSTMVERINAREKINIIESRYTDIAKECAAKTVIRLDGSRILYVHGGDRIGCKLYEHPVISATGLIWVNDNKQERININYCLECDRCFISNAEYQSMHDKFGVMYVRFEWIDRNGSRGTDSMFANDSPLSLAGYTVDAKTNLSVGERHEILTNLIRMNILSKPRVIDYLNQFIKVNGAKPNMSSAVAKWAADLIFVRNLEINEQPTVHIGSVRKW